MLGRLLWACVLFYAMTVVIFALFFLIPNDLPRQVAGPGSSPAAQQRAMHYLGLDQPEYVQYERFVWRLVKPVPVRVDGVPVLARPRGDLGRSFLHATSVNYLVSKAAPVTASVVFGGLLLALLVAVPVGLLSGLRPGSPLDRMSMTFVLLGLSVHPVPVGLVLSYALGFKLDVRRPGGDLTWAAASLETRHGLVAIRWSLADGVLSVATTLPPGVTGVLSLPDGVEHEVGPGTQNY